MRRGGQGCTEVSFAGTCPDFHLLCSSQNQTTGKGPGDVFLRLQDVSLLLPTAPRSAYRSNKLGVFPLRKGLFHLCKAQLEAGFMIFNLRNDR